MFLAARNLLLEGGSWSSRWAGSEGGEKGVDEVVGAVDQSLSVFSATHFIAFSMISVGDDQRIYGWMAHLIG